MPTKKRPHKERRLAASRLRTVFHDWQVDEQAHGRSHSLTGFAEVLGYNSHSAIGDMIAGRREVSASVLCAARGRWQINPDWLLGYSGVQLVTAVVQPGTLETMLAERVRLALATEMTAPDLAFLHTDSDDVGAALVALCVRQATDEAAAILQRRDDFEHAVNLAEGIERTPLRAWDANDPADRDGRETDRARVRLLDSAREQARRPFAVPLHIWTAIVRRGRLVVAPADPVPPMGVLWLAGDLRVT